MVRQCETDAASGLVECPMCAAMVPADVVTCPACANATIDPYGKGSLWYLGRFVCRCFFGFSLLLALACPPATGLGMIGDGARVLAVAGSIGMVVSGLAIRRLQRQDAEAAAERERQGRSGILPEPEAPTGMRIRDRS